MTLFWLMLFVVVWAIVYWRHALSILGWGLGIGLPAYFFYKIGYNGNPLVPAVLFILGLFVVAIIMVFTEKKDKVNND